jgi:hypothetical protein
MCGIPPFGYFITHFASKMNPIFAAIFSSFNAIIFLLLSMKYQVFFAPFATVIGCATMLYALYNIITERYLTKINLFINQFYLGLFIYANSSANYCSQNLIISMATWIIIHISIILYIHYLENITQHKLHVYNITLLAAKQWQRVAIIMPIICLILPISNMPTAYILQTIHSNIFAITATAAVGIIVSYKLIYGAIIVHNQSINNKQYCRLYHQMVACIMLIIALLLTQHYYLNITHNASHYHLVPYIAQLAMFVTIILSLIRYNKIILPYIAIEPHKTDIQIAYSQIIAPFLRILSTIIVQFITLFYRIMLMAVQSVAKHNHINYITKLNNSINIFNPAVTIYVFFTLLLAMLYCIM